MKRKVYRKAQAEEIVQTNSEMRKGKKGIDTENETRNRTECYVENRWRFRGVQKL